MATDPLAGVLVPSQAGAGVSTFSYGLLFDWDPVTHANQVQAAGGVTFVDCPVLNPASLGTGDVLLYFGPAGPIVLGMLVKP